MIDRRGFLKCAIGAVLLPRLEVSPARGTIDVWIDGIHGDDKRGDGRTPTTAFRSFQGALDRLPVYCGDLTIRVKGSYPSVWYYDTMRRLAR